MSLSRIWALVPAAVGAAFLASIPPLFADRFAERAGSSFTASTNGTVVSVNPVSQGFEVVVEFRPGASGPTLSLRSEGETVGLVRPRPRLVVGDRVIVEHDPVDPRKARLFTQRKLWQAVGSRVLAALVSLAAAVALCVGAPSRRPGRRPSSSRAFPP